MVPVVAAIATLEFLDVPILVLDEDLAVRSGNQSGYLAASTASAPLRIHKGRAVPRIESDAAVLVTLMRSEWPRVVTFAGGTPGRALVVPAVADALTMLRCAFVVFCENPPELLQPDILRHVCGLTSAEAEVAVMVALRGISECARARRTTVGTVRSQVKCIMAKLELRSMTHLARLVVLAARSPLPPNA